MKNLFIIILMIISLFISKVISSEKESDYIKVGNLDNGVVQSIVDYPKEFSGFPVTRDIHPNSYGKSLYFSIYIRPTNIVGHARLWMRLDNKNRKWISIRHGDYIKGTNNHFKKYHLTVSNIPNNAKYIAVGVYLKGAGKVEMKNYLLK